MTLTLQQYVQKYGPNALAVQQQTGIDAASMLAISYNEGGADPTTIAGGPAGAFFGVKSSSSQPSGDKGTISVPTREVIGGSSVMVQGVFNSYSSFAAAAQGFVQFLQSNSRYAGALANAANPAAFISGLGSAGYATDPAWASKITSLRNTIAQQLQGVTPSPGGVTDIGSGLPIQIPQILPGQSQAPTQTQTQAQTTTTTPPPSGSTTPPASSATFTDSLLHLLITVGLIVAALVIAYMGITMMRSSSGDQGGRTTVIAGGGEATEAAEAAAA